jgi:sulfur-oxidizing protein SoxY
MDFTRRDVCAIGTALAALTALPAWASTDLTQEAINAFTGGAAAADGGISIDAPEIAENGNTVPVGVSAEGAVSIMVLADGNPRPGVATFHFGELAGSTTASTRIRLAKTQNVVAVAKMADGSFKTASKEVKVTIGGCGG